MYHVSAQGVDERRINVHYYYLDYFRLGDFVQHEARSFCMGLCRSGDGMVRQKCSGFLLQLVGPSNDSSLLSNTVQFLRYALHLQTDQ